MSVQDSTLWYAEWIKRKMGGFERRKANPFLGVWKGELSCSAGSALWRTDVSISCFFNGFIIIIITFFLFFSLFHVRNLFLFSVRAYGDLRFLCYVMNIAVLPWHCAEIVIFFSLSLRLWHLEWVVVIAVILFLSLVLRDVHSGFGGARWFYTKSLGVRDAEVMVSLRD